MDVTLSLDDDAISLASYAKSITWEAVFPDNLHFAVNISNFLWSSIPNHFIFFPIIKILNI